MAKTLYISDPIFKTDTLLIWDCTSEELGKFLEKKHNLVDFDYKHVAHADGTVIQLDSYPYRVVWFEKVKLTPYWLGVVAHELTHHVVRICSWKGIPFDGRDNNDETFAYLMDFYMMSLMTEVTKKRNVRKKRTSS